MISETRSQNRKAVETERDSRSHTEFNFKSVPTLLSIFFLIIQKVSNNVGNCFPNVETESKVVKSERDSRSHIKSKIKYSTLISRQEKGKMSEKSQKKIRGWFSEPRVRIEKQSKLSEIDAHTNFKVK